MSQENFVYKTGRWPAWSETKGSVVVLFVSIWRALFEVLIFIHLLRQGLYIGQAGFEALVILSQSCWAGIKGLHYHAGELAA